MAEAGWAVVETCEPCQNVWADSSGPWGLSEVKVTLGVVQRRDERRAGLRAEACLEPGRAGVSLHRGRPLRVREEGEPERGSEPRSRLSWDVTERSKTRTRPPVLVGANRRTVLLTAFGNTGAETGVRWCR